MCDSLGEIIEKTETGYNLVVTQENQDIWQKMIEHSKCAARERYLELYPGTDISASMTAQIWIEGFQAGYIGGVHRSFP